MLELAHLLELSPQEFTAHLVQVSLHNLGEIDSHLPELAKALVIPKFFNDEIIRLFLHEEAPITIDEAKLHLAQFFQISQGSHDETRYYFHDLQRDELLKFWDNDKDGLKKYQKILKGYYLDKASYFRQQYESYLVLWGNQEA